MELPLELAPKWSRIRIAAGASMEPRDAGLGRSAWRDHLMSAEEDPAPNDAFRTIVGGGA